MSQPKKNSVWVFVGEFNAADPAVAYKHRVVEVSSQGVITWSEPNPIDEAHVGGWSWFGPVLDFLKQFKPLMTPEGWTDTDEDDGLPEDADE